jgi:SWI/SNF-related matrix-associated actin-dependent regulator of chromatin subfamily A3
MTEISQKTAPPDSRGGLLADQMGLGKSLTMISLIALNSCKRREPIVFTTEGCLKRLKSTLVVVPYSREWKRARSVGLSTDPKQF